MSCDPEYYKNLVILNTVSLDDSDIEHINQKYIKWSPNRDHEHNQLILVKKNENCVCDHDCACSEYTSIYQVNFYLNIACCEFMGGVFNDSDFYNIATYLNEIIDNESNNKRLLEATEFKLFMYTSSDYTLNMEKLEIVSETILGIPLPEKLQEWYCKLYPLKFVDKPDPEPESPQPKTTITTTTRPSFRSYNKSPYVFGTTKPATTSAVSPATLVTTTTQPPSSASASELSNRFNGFSYTSSNTNTSSTTTTKPTFSGYKAPTTTANKSQYSFGKTNTNSLYKPYTTTTTTATATATPTALSTFGSRRPVVPTNMFAKPKMFG